MTRRALSADLTGVYGKTPVRFIGYQALLKNKLAAARPKDLADVAALGRVARSKTD